MYAFSNTGSYAGSHSLERWMTIQIYYNTLDKFEERLQILCSSKVYKELGDHIQTFTGVLNYRNSD